MEGANVSECDDTIQRIDSMLFADSTTPTGACGGDEQVRVLDELRERLLLKRGRSLEYDAEGDAWNEGIDECVAIIDAFAAEHPGIVDLTVCGPQCPAYQPYEWQMCCYAMSGWDIAPTGQPCPVLAARNGG